LVAFSFIVVVEGEQPDSIMGIQTANLRRLVTKLAKNPS